MRWLSFFTGMLVGGGLEWGVDHLFGRRGHQHEDKSKIELRRSLAAAQDRVRALEQKVAHYEQQVEQLAECEGLNSRRSAIRSRRVNPPLLLREDEIEELKASLAATKAGRTSFSVSPTPVEPDELRKIEGIGPKIAEILNEHGILTFEQLAETKVRPPGGGSWKRPARAFGWLSRRRGRSRRRWRRRAIGRVYGCFRMNWSVGDGRLRS